MDRLQVNVRLTPEQLTEIDKKRIELQPKYGKILTRSDVIRLALEDYLTRNVPNTQSVGRTRRSQDGN